MSGITFRVRLGWLRPLVISLACAASTGPLWAATPSSGVEIPQNRFLTGMDLQGHAHHLGNGEDYKAVALVFMNTECPISREYVPELNRLAEQCKDQGVRFFGVISDRNTTLADAVAYQNEFKIAFPVLFDGSCELAHSFGPTHVPEAFVLGTDAKVAYRGRIDDLYGELRKKRQAATTHDLADAIAAVAAGKEVAQARTTPVGCPVEAKSVAADASKATYNRDIAPILYSQCAECHRPGEVAPFSLLTYEDASKRAQFLSDVTHKRVMPPWKARIDHGRFLGERHLSDAQLALLEGWAKAGAPEGNPADRPKQPEFASGWRLGKPDLELKAPSFTVRAGGEDIFQHFIIPMELLETKTVVGFEFRPGDPSVVHHAILFLDSTGSARKKDAETPEPGYTTFGSIGVAVSGIIGVWTPGMTPRHYPQNSGLVVRKGTDLVLQLHIHPSGKEATDQSSVALYFADKPVAREMARGPFLIGSIMIDIPAGTSDHELTSSITLPTDVTLISMLPHMHLIGKEMKVTATLPDGTEKPIIWIDDWNFFAQDNYVFHEPLRLPKGTRVDLFSRYDNSADNPLNPSKPPHRVFFGNGSTDEMCFGIFQIIVDNPGEEMRMHGALMQTFMRDWKNAKLDNEARERIIVEAGKLFGDGGGGEVGGAGAGGGDLFRSLFSSGGGSGGRGAKRNADGNADKRQLRNHALES